MKTRFIVPLAFSLFIAVSAASQSAEVTKIKKKKGMVYINEGKESGIKKGSKVCFFKTEDKKVGCGKVRKAKKTKAIVKVKKKIAKKIKKGYSAKLDQPEGKTEDKGVAEAPKAFVIRGFYNLALMTPFTFNNIHYSPITADQTESQWTSADSTPAKISNNYMGFGGELEHEGWGVVAGGRLHIISAVETNAADGEKVSEFLPSNFGLYLDYVFYKIAGLKLGAGLDIDMTSLSFSDNWESTNTANKGLGRAEYNGSLTTISLRAPIRYAMIFGGFEAFVNFDILVPLVGSASGDPEFHADLKTDAIATSLGKTPEEDFKEQLGFQKNAVGVSLSIGAGYRM